MVAAEKIKRKGLTELAMLEPVEFTSDLPEHIDLFQVPFCKGGEIWVTVTFEARDYWLVCDGIMNISKLSENIFKAFLQRMYGLRVELWITPIFIRNITDQAAFKPWFSGWISGKQQPVLIPCHGDVDRDPDLTQRLCALVESRLTPG